MWRKLTFLIAVVLVPGLLNSAVAVDKNWTGTESSDWCTGGNWSPAGVPAPNDGAFVKVTASHDPVIDGSICADVNIHRLWGPGYESDGDQVMTIVDANVNVQNTWWWDERESGAHTGTATVNIIGNTTMTVAVDDTDLYYWACIPGRPGTTSILNISGNENGEPNIFVNGTIRPIWYNLDGLLFELNISAGYLRCRNFEWFRGSGRFSMSGGTIVCEGGIGFSGENGGTFEWNMTGGLIQMGGTLNLGSSSEAISIVNLDDGIIECGNFDVDDEAMWTMDINDAVLKIQGDKMSEMQALVDDGHITGYNGTVKPAVGTEGDWTIVRCAYIQKTASKPSPETLASLICPNEPTLSWTPGVYAVDHNVYFGPSLDDVNGSKDPCLVRYDYNDWTIPYTLELGRTYYWRVDEINDSNVESPWEGSIWRFSTESGRALDPVPVNNRRGIPYASLSLLEWTPSCVADSHKVYFGQDLPSSILLFEDNFEDGFDPNWLYTTDWEIYNATGDSNYAPHDHNLAKADGTGEILECDDLDTSDACSFDVDFDILLSKDLSAGTLELKYYNGGYTTVADWNSVDANDANDKWFHYHDTITGTPYQVANFRIRLETTGLDRPVYIDDVRIRNTWPAAAKWYKGQTVEPNYPVSVEEFKTYYWRVDTVIDGTTIKGNRWSFGTGRGGLLMWYSFDGTQGNDLDSTVTDDTNSVTFTKYLDPADAQRSVKYGASNTTYNSEGTSADIEPNAGLYRLDPCAPSSASLDFLRLDGYQYTIEMWVRFDRLEEGMSDIRLISKRGSWEIFVNDPGDNDAIRMRHCGNPEGPDDTAVADEWQHVAAVYNRLDPSEDRMKLYVDGLLVNTNDEEGLNPADNNGTIGIGFEPLADGSFGNFFDGKIDELRIYDMALKAGQFLLTPGPEWASNPHPYNRQMNVDPNDPNLVLSWTPGTKADTHRVYFSTNFDDVNNASAQAYLGEYDTNETNDISLKCGKTYYWRVDEVNTQTWEGVVWKFTTKYQIVDVNLVVWYPFDEEMGEDVYDTSGYGKDGELDGPADGWEPANGRFGGCRHFDDDTTVEFPSDVLVSISDGITLSMWLNGEDQKEVRDNWVIDAGAFDYHLQVKVPDKDDCVYWRAGNDSNDALAWEVDTTGWKGEWHHLAFVKDEGSDEMYIYFDGGVGWWKPAGTVNSLSNIKNRPFKMGAKLDHSNDYEGRIDDFRVYDYAKPESEIKELYRGGDLASAWGPSPFDGQTDAPRDVNLVWNPGDFADSHDVYFGTDYEAVRDANTSVTLGVFRGNTTDTVNDIEILSLDTWYFWRIDEVNDTNYATWKGNIWKFKVADYIIIDDFESYVDDAHLRMHWCCGAACSYTNNSIVARGVYNAASHQYPSHGGDQMMRYQYYTFSSPYWSEAYLPLAEVGVTNWQEEGVKALTLFFYGKPSTYLYPQDRMYVGINDTAGNYAEIAYGEYERIAAEDINDLNEPEWHRWFIGLPDFNDPCYAAAPCDVDLSDVNAIFIGFGNKRNPQWGSDGEVRFDDIRLNLPICRPDIIKPVGDFTGRRGLPDCVVDLADIGYMADEWLYSDANLVDIMEEPCDANLVGHWKLDGDPCDSSGYDHNSTIEGSFSWVVGHANDLNPTDGAVQFTGDGGRILVGDTNELRPKHQVSVSAWVYASGRHDDTAVVVVKGENDKETYDLEVDNDDDPIVLNIRDVNGNKHDATSEDSIPTQEWVHLAATYDGNTIRLYLNAYAMAARTDPNIKLSQDTAGLAIGNRPEDTDYAFIGAIDDVRVYDYGLSEGEVAWLATDGTGFTKLSSQANLYDLEVPGEKAVNFRDLAWLIAEHWLDEVKWP